jgi:hypothetical protein
MMMPPNPELLLTGLDDGASSFSHSFYCKKPSKTGGFFNVGNRRLRFNNADRNSPRAPSAMPPRNTEADKSLAEATPPESLEAGSRRPLRS